MQINNANHETNKNKLISMANIAFEQAVYQLTTENPVIQRIMEKFDEVWSRNLNGYIPNLRKIGFHGIIHVVVSEAEEQKAIKKLVSERASDILKLLIRQDGTVQSPYSWFDSIDPSGRIICTNGKIVSGSITFGNVVHSDPYVILTE